MKRVANMIKEREFGENPKSLKSIIDVKLDLEDKYHIHIHETITNMAILVHMKKNI